MAIPQSPNRIKMYGRQNERIRIENEGEKQSEIRSGTQATGQQKQYRNRQPYKTKMMNFAEHMLPLPAVNNTE